MPVRDFEDFDSEGSQRSRELLQGNTSVLPRDGVAWFSNLIVLQARSWYVLSFTPNNTQISAVRACKFYVEAGCATQLVFKTQPYSHSCGPVESNVTKNESSVGVCNGTK
jgi:hypothetical protein